MRSHFHNVQATPLQQEPSRYAWQEAVGRAGLAAVGACRGDVGGYYDTRKAYGCSAVGRIRSQGPVDGPLRAELSDHRSITNSQSRVITPACSGSSAR
jgi:hypothetical protein